MSAERCLFCTATAEERDCEKARALNDPYLDVPEGSKAYVFLAAPTGTCPNGGASGHAPCIYLSDGKP